MTDSSHAAAVRSALFETGALRISPADRPFWYTSGLFGPYYINTHFLIGGETAAGDLLQSIDRLSAEDRDQMTGRILTQCRDAYRSSATYRATMDALLSRARTLDFDLISGGERRDYFFSVLLAALCGTPHLTVFKDGTLRLADGPDLAHSAPVIGTDPALTGRRVLHVADLVTEASSYVRAWLPAIRKTGARIDETLVVVDRQQGGEEVLQREGVVLHALVRLDDALFTEALTSGVIDRAQLDAVRAYHADPIGFVRAFLRQHPDFIDHALAQGGSAAERAQRCLDSGYVTP